MKKTSEQETTTASKLPLSVKLGFGIGDLGGNLFFTAMGFYSLIYLTDTVGLGASLAGIAILIGKFWDAVTDPMVGFLSDRTRSRWGRRRPYLLFGALPLLLAMWYFFSAPDYSGAQTAGFLWWCSPTGPLVSGAAIIPLLWSWPATGMWSAASTIRGNRFLRNIPTAVSL